MAAAGLLVAGGAKAGRTAAAGDEEAAGGAKAVTGSEVEAAGCRGCGMAGCPTVGASLRQGRRDRWRGWPMRGWRIGEADHPGPRTPKGLRIGTINVSSWHRHGAAALDVAAAHGVDVLLGQEAGLTETTLPGAAARARAAGWHLTATPMPPGRVANAGVFLAARQPFTLLPRGAHVSPEQQGLTAEVCGPGGPVLTVVTWYRRPARSAAEMADDWAPLMEAIAAQGSRPLVVGGDFNADLREEAGPASALRSAGLLPVVTAPRPSGQRHIDGLFATARLAQQGARGWAEEGGVADHALVMMETPAALDRGPRQWRFGRTAKLAADPGGHAEGGEARPEGLRAATAEEWAAAAQRYGLRRLLREDYDVERTWAAWSSAAEEALRVAGAWREGHVECPKGRTPQLRHGAARRAQGQPQDEREARRLVRRAREARTQWGRRQEVHQPLWDTLRRNAGRLLGREPPERPHEQGVHDLVKEAELYLTRIVADGARRRVEAWRTRCAGSLGASAKWLRSEAPPPAVVADPETGRSAAGPAAGAALLRDWWAALLQRPSAPPPSRIKERFEEAFGGYAPPGPEWEVQALSAGDLQEAARRGRGKAAGPDGWAAEELLLLPQEAWEALACILGRWEESGLLPEAIVQWRMCFIPKAGGPAAVGHSAAGSQNAPTPADKVRPISVGAIVYRMWGSARVRQLGDQLQAMLPQGQAGGVKRSSALHVLLELQWTDPETESYGATYDFAKAFDHVEPHTAVWLLERAGVPSAITRVLRTAWSRQTRWAGFDGGVHPVPIRECRGLPQGDPWSPVAMAAVLAPAVRALAATKPGVRQGVYMDDRTALTRSLRELDEVHEFWQNFSEISGIPGNPNKTQIWGRSQRARRALRGRANVTASPEVLGAALAEGPSPLGGTRPADAKRWARFEAKALRLRHLPDTRMRARLAVVALAPVVGWACLVGGEAPPAFRSGQYTTALLRAIGGARQKWTRASRNLLALVRLGHGGDLRFAAAHRLAKLLGAWPGTAARLEETRRPGAVQPRFLAALDSVFAAYGWARTMAGRWERGAVPHAEGDAPPTQAATLDLAETSSVLPALHALREDWRCAQLWLWRKSARRDAAMAREQGVVPTAALADWLRAAAKKVDAHGVAVLTGGMSTAATASVVPQRCPDCGEDVVPCIQHVLWECSAYRRHRRLQPPAQALGRRMGWPAAPTRAAPTASELALVRQLAAIRAEEAKTRLWREGYREAARPARARGAGDA